MSKKQLIEKVIKQINSVCSACDMAFPDEPPISATIVGSTGLMLLGIEYPEDLEPNDIDIACHNISRAIFAIKLIRKKLQKSDSFPFRCTKCKDTTSNLISINYKFIDKISKEEITVQLLDAHDFGFTKDSIYHIDTGDKKLQVISPRTALQSLITRIENKGIRPKDRMALKQLVCQYGKDILETSDKLPTNIVELITLILENSQDKIIHTPKRT